MIFNRRKAVVRDGSQGWIEYTIPAGELFTIPTTFTCVQHDGDGPDSFSVKVEDYFGFRNAFVSIPRSSTHRWFITSSVPR